MYEVALTLFRADVKADACNEICLDSTTLQTAAEAAALLAFHFTKQEVL